MFTSPRVEKAKDLFAANGISDALALYVSPPANPTKDQSIVIDIACKGVQYGGLTAKQVNFVKSLLQRIKEQPNRDAVYAAEKAAAADCPSGLHTIKATILKAAFKAGQFGEQLKMTVKAESGFLAYGTCPVPLSGTKGDVIELTATFTPSENDPKFGFFSRPKGKLLQAAQVSEDVA
jgi:hypothetical protein